METKGLTHWGDQLVLAAYFVAILLVGIWSLYRSNRKTVTGYFLAGRSMMWIPVGASLFSSNIGAEHFIGLAGTGAASGVSVILYEWLAVILLVYLGWLFLPVYISAGVYTMPEYLEKRFGAPRIRIYLSCLSMVLYIVTKLAVSIYAGSVFIQLAMGWDMYLSIIVLLLVTGIFTVLGGLTAVMYTDTLQTAIMLIGSITLAATGFREIGGYENLKMRYMNATASVRDANTTCGLPRQDAFSVVRHPVDSDNPFPAVFLFIVYGCIWYWCCDQVIVQRALAAKSLSHAKAGALLAGYLKLLPIFAMIFPGMISRALFPDEIACVDPDECVKYCGNPVGCTNSAYPKLALELLPTGLRGLLMAVMMSAIMSSLSSIFNSSSTLFTMDLWPRIRKSASPRELLITGRIFIMVLAALSILWIPLVKSKQSGGLFVYINVVQSYLATPISPVFVFAVLWKRMTEKAAFWSLIIGQLIGLVRMIMDFSMAAPGCGEPETRPEVLYKVHYAYFGVILSVITSVSVVVISLFTTPMANVDGLTFWTRYEHTEQADTSDKLQTNPELETQDEETIAADVKAESHRYTSWLYTLCGIPKTSEKVPASVERAILHKDAFLTETQKIKKFLDVNAVLAVVIVIVLIAIFH